MKDNTVVDNGVAGATAILKNKMNADFFAECAKASLKVTADLSYDSIVDAISELNVEDESKVFVVIPNTWKAKLRKDADYVAARMGEVVYSGQVGTICGIPVVASKAITDTAYVMTPEAVKLFIKKDIGVGQERDEDTTINSVYIRAYYIAALVDATKICKIANA
jgi:HK97 family phage major capsid protein